MHEYDEIFHVLYDSNFVKKISIDGGLFLTLFGIGQNGRQWAH